jgi:hypothetical protein
VKPKARRRRRAVRVTRTAAVASALVTAGPSGTTGGTAGIAAASSASRQLVLLPRDPDWLYACWDFAATELEAAQSQTRDRRLILRVFKANARQACQEITVLPGARDWFIAVHEPDTIFHAELAWRGAGDCWRVLATSRPARTPPRVVAPAGTEQFVQILVDVPFHELARLAGARGAEADQLAYTLHRLQAEGHLRGGLLAPADNWDEDRRQRLAALLQRIQPARGTSGGPFSPPPRRRVSHRQ